ncbi:flagellar hook protein FlgE [Pseudobutyrivibrio sp. 49]|uniref:flagellar hook protein FlgE n=1 Tax=Pseudobutyrivibrio sp. 49 TaxID=1855344 RepID=UPI00089220C2|nr:flagellar hook-basal body complex protein [Pseudobutyrivibrio sp. 49]SDH37077.1 flagellar hook protein FlgE [Pseudobutyrivibrio sp. 49]
MMRSLFSGVAGLKTHQTKMDVIGNNIANVNTVAFKSSATTFSDIMYQTTQQASGATATRGGTNAKQIGLGVTNGATKVSITSAGAAQSTGDALDIRLTDANSTNFFIVNNGSQNLFTRAGSFYIDGNGNLAMTTTGYLVMGWQVDPDDPSNIIKDTVSALRVMRTENLTSAPEATTAANFAGVIDKNDSQFESTGGYVRTFTLYDNLGYAYTAKFSIKKVDGTMGRYTIELTNVLDQDNHDVLADYISNGGKLEDIFGTNDITTKEYNFSSAVKWDDNVTNVDGTSTGGYVFTDSSVSPAVKYLIDKNSENPPSFVLKELDSDGNLTGTSLAYDASKHGFPYTNAEGDEVVITLTQLLGVPTSDLTDITDGGVDLNGFDPSTKATTSPAIKVSFNTVNYGIQFDTQEGTLLSVGNDGGTKLMFNAHLLGPNRSDEDPINEELQNNAMSDIEIEFASLLNYDNKGTSTVVANRGIPDGSSMRGEGKKLGTMTGLSVQNDGKIFGSYSNGNTVLLGQIAVAQFANASGLEEKGDNCYDTTLNSGEFDGIGIDISADGSSMNTGQLEMANVDLSSEFTDMITTQRGFQANSRIITVSDTMLEELINLKR